MFLTKRIRSARIRGAAAAAVAVAVTAAGIGVGVAASASAAVSNHAPARAAGHAPKISVNRFNMNGYVINAKYTLGRNTGNTFQQTYKTGTVQGVPIAGPNVGVTFPPEDYVALPIGDDQVYITWLDPSTFAIVDVFVMNFRTHTVYDYAPGSATPQSAGTITIVKRGARLP